MATLLLGDLDPGKSPKIDLKKGQTFRHVFGDPGIHNFDCKINSSVYIGFKRLCHNFCDIICVTKSFTTKVPEKAETKQTQVGT